MKDTTIEGSAGAWNPGEQGTLRHSEDSRGHLPGESCVGTRTGKRKRRQLGRKRRGRTFKCREQHVQGLRGVRSTAVKGIAVCLHWRVCGGGL